MSGLCRCVAYGYVVHILFSHFSTADPKNSIGGSFAADILLSFNDVIMQAHAKEREISQQLRKRSDIEKKDAAGEAVKEPPRQLIRYTITGKTFQTSGCLRRYWSA